MPESRGQIIAAIIGAVALVISALIPLIIPADMWMKLGCHDYEERSLIEIDTGKAYQKNGMDLYFSGRVLLDGDLSKCRLVHHFTNRLNVEGQPKKEQSELPIGDDGRFERTMGGGRLFAEQYLDGTNEMWLELYRGESLLEKKEF